MAHQPSRNPLRLLAPAALVVCLLAFGFVVLRSGSGDDEGAPAGDTATQPKTSGKQAGTTPKKPKPKPATYTVKAGDSLGSIAEQTGVPVDRLRELNPELDPQALVSGQKIKLKE